MKHYIWMEVQTTNASRVLVKLFKQNIVVLEVEYGEKSLRIKILEQDVKKLKKLVGYRFTKVRESGFYAILEMLKKKYLIFLGFILFFCFLFLFSHVIVSVAVIHSNKEIRTLVSNALEEHGIKRLTFKKNFQELSSIKEAILREYPDKLEWLEIEVKGMKYIIRVEERIITEEETKKERCHLVATKSAIVKSMQFSLGDANVAVNDFVKEGDILVRGDLVFNEEVKGEVCATGEVYGEVWYTTQVTLPLDYEEKKETGKERWNFKWTKGGTDYLIFRPRLSNYIDDDKHLFSFLGFGISFVKQKEVEIETKKYSLEEALKKVDELIEEKFKMKLLEKERIIDKKVLKKQVNDSTMEVEVFVSVLENISRQEEFQEIKEEG